MADFNKDIEIDGKVTAKEVEISGNSGLTFTGEFDLSKNRAAFYNDYLSGGVVNLTLSATKVLGSMCTVRILGGLVGTIAVEITNGQTGDDISVSPNNINEITLLYVSDIDVRMINRVFPLTDTESPTIPVGLNETSKTDTSTILSWTASTDNFSVTGYRIFRDAIEVGTSATNSFTDTGLTAETAYSYTVTAYDAATNESSQSSALVITTDVTQVANDPLTVLGANLDVWVDGSDSSQMTLSGSSVTSIIDKTSNFTFNNEGTAPTFSTDKIIFNEVGVLRSSVNSTLLNHGQNFHGFLIFKNNSSTQASFIANAADTSNRFAIGMRNGELSAGTYNGTAFNCKSVVFTDQSSFHKLEFKLVAGVMTVLLDDVNLTNTNTVATTVLPEFVIGGAGSGTPKGFDFKDFFVKSGEMTTQERSDILAYISNEHAL